MIRSRSRWNAVRTGCSGSWKRRPRLACEHIAYGASVRASVSSSSWRVRSTLDGITGYRCAEEREHRNSQIPRLWRFTYNRCWSAAVAGTRILIDWRAAVAVSLALALASCSTSTPTAPVVPPPPPPQPANGSIVGVASWYGPGFDGHRTSSGETYNQEDLTAASSLYPLGSRVMVTNLDNDRSVAVTINDHGPFKKGRKIDLSRSAARVLGLIGPGTARVRIDLMSAPQGSRPVGPPRYVVQAGSFANSASASRLRDALARSYPDVHIEQIDIGSQRYYRVRMGAFSTRQEAEERAADTARTGQPAVVITE